MWTWTARLRTAAYAIIATGLGAFGVSMIREEIATGRMRTNHGARLLFDTHPVWFGVLACGQGLFTAALFALGLLCAWSFLFPDQKLPERFTRLSR